MIHLRCSSYSASTKYVENNPMKTPDQILIDRITNKDEAAFYEFYNRYAALLYRWAYNRVGSEEITEEITQEFWAQFWLNPIQIKTNAEGNAKNYLLHFFTYRVLDYIRANMTRKIFSSIGDELDLLSRTLIYSHISEEIEEKEIYTLIDEIIATLPELTQKVFNHRWKDDLSTEETAKLLNIDEKAVYNRMYTAISIIREKVSLMLQEGDTMQKIKTINMGALAIWYSLMK
ncbi:RNA polymerase sigma factor [Flavobacterium microcysteis]|uniref:RNA polymerase sigma factor n=2 Tax=Flavobacterium microcysteis TaxID=2596891 RepID=A0A501QCU6_9FLAO|nr:RNA polymerase sigma factor [Flavobacterium microcysteis]